MPNHIDNVQSLRLSVSQLTKRVDHLERLLTQRSVINATASKYEVVIATVAESYRFAPDDLTGRSRVAEVALARQVAMVLCIEVRPHVANVAARFKRDRGTVLWALQAIADRRKTDRKFDTEFASVREHVLRTLAEWESGPTKEAA